MCWTSTIIGLLIAAAIIIVIICIYYHTNKWGMHRHQLAHELSCALTRPWRMLPLAKLFHGTTIDSIEDVKFGCQSNPSRGQIVKFTVHVPEYGINYWHFEGLYDVEHDVYVEFKPIDEITSEEMSNQIATRQ